MALPIASVQLYSLADTFASDMSGSLDRLAEIGLPSVEAFAFVDSATDFRAALDNSGLTAPTGHASLLSQELWTPDKSSAAPPPEAVFEAAALIGMKTVIDPFVAPDRWLTLDAVKETAERLNTLAETAATFGLSVGYHNHAQEFVATFEGTSAFETFVNLTEDRVAIELDLFWALTGGQDVPALVSRLGERLVALHVKDGIVPTPNPFAGDTAGMSTATLDQRRPGTGEVPLAESLRASQATYAVLEYDNPPGDVFEDIAAGYTFLREGGFVR